MKKLSKKETPLERQISKSMILGLGYGLGPFKFATELLKGMLGADPVQFKREDAAKFNVDVEAFEHREHGRSGVTCGERVEEMITFGARLSYADLLIHTAVADHFVRLYRERNPKIKNMWYACNEALRVMAEPRDDGGRVRMRLGCLDVVRHGLVKPNGLMLQYPGLTKTKDGYRYRGGKSGREFVKAYGGLITENVVQSLARDVVMEQTLWVRSEGYKIGTTTHDEIVAVVREGEGETALAKMIGHMRTPPLWCQRLPLNAEGGFGKSYGAVK